MKREKSCGALVVRKSGSGYDIVLLRNWMGGHWSFPKGHVEAGETEHQTAAREVKEETGLDISFIEGFRHTVEYNPRPDVTKLVVYFLAEAINEDLVPQESEISDIKWEPMDNVENSVTFANDKRLIRKAKEILGLPVPPPRNNFHKYYSKGRGKR